MNKRTLLIIKELKKRNQIITISGLAEKFEVSTRTIRNDIGAINEILAENGLAEVAFQNKGQVIRTEQFSQISKLVSDGDFYTYKLSKEERIKVASTLLIGAVGYITLSEIADRLFVSRATIINDLDDVKSYIKGGKLEVLSHPNKGLRVEGRESDKRLLLMRIAGADRVMTEEENAVTKHISVQAGNRITLQKILSEQEKIHGSFLTDDSFNKVLLYLGIMLNRSLQGDYIETRTKADNSKYRMAQDIFKYIAQYCHINFTEDEVQFLSEMLSVAKYMKQKTDKKEAVKIQLITRQFIRKVSEELGINLNGDYDFFENLSNHLESVFTEVLHNYPDDPLIDEVLEENQEVAAVVRNKMNFIQAHVQRDITEVETDYIAVHVCAAVERKKNREIAFRVIISCHAGIGTSQLLLEKLKKHFNFRIVDIISSHEAKQIEPEKADFIITTVPLKECKLDFVVVSPLLNDEDYIRVGNKIDALRNSRHLPSRVDHNEISSRGLLEEIYPILDKVIPEQADVLKKEIRKVVRGYFMQPIEAEIYSPGLHHLLPSTHIELDVECSDWREAVKKSAKRLLESGYIEERYIASMIRNIEENGPYIVLSKGFAMPHDGLETGSVKAGMNLIRLKTPIPFGEEEFDPVEFVCCLSAVDHKTHLKAFFNLVNMLSEGDFKKALSVCRTPEEAADIIEKYEYDVGEYQKI